MRLKFRPEDFVVKERPGGFDPDGRGDYAVYELTKRKLTTLEAVGILAREFGLERRDIDFAGLKDRQSVSKQVISIPGGMREFHSPEMQLRYMGRSAEPVSSAINDANVFSILVRDCTPRDLDVLEQNVREVREHGVPNYFDDQRFACVRFGQGWIARDLIQGRFEDALRTLIATSLPSDPRTDRDLKEYISRRWGHWDELADRLGERQRFGGVIRYLADNPGDYTGALIRIGTPIKTIHLFAYQSYIWNRTVSSWLGRWLPPNDVESLGSASGKLSVWTTLEEPYRSKLHSVDDPLTIPLIDHTTQIADGRIAKALNDVLREEDLRLSQFRIPAEGIFFREEPREVVLQPADLHVHETQRDELFRHRFKVRFQFSLPRGSYGTLVVRRLFLGAQGANGLRAPSLDTRGEVPVKREWRGGGQRRSHQHQGGGNGYDRDRDRDGGGRDHSYRGDRGERGERARQDPRDVRPDKPKAKPAPAPQQQAAPRPQAQPQPAPKPAVPAVAKASPSSKDGTNSKAAAGKRRAWGKARVRRGE